MPLDRGTRLRSYEIVSVLGIEVEGAGEIKMSLEQLEQLILGMLILCADAGVDGGDQSLFTPSIRGSSIASRYVRQNAIASRHRSRGSRPSKGPFHTTNSYVDGPAGVLPPDVDTPPSRMVTFTLALGSYSFTTLPRSESMKSWKIGGFNFVALSCRHAASMRRCVATSAAGRYLVEHVSDRAEQRNHCDPASPLERCVRACLIVGKRMFAIGKGQPRSRCHLLTLKHLPLSACPS